MTKSRKLRDALSFVDPSSTPVDWSENSRPRPGLDDIAVVKKLTERRLFSRAKTSRDVETRRLVNRMRQCGPRRRCQIGGCCHCEAVAQQTVVSWLAPAFSRISAGRLQLSALHFVHDVGACPQGSLNENGVASGKAASAVVSQAIRRALREAEVTEFIVGLDICLCQDRRPSQIALPRWNIHAHGILETNDAQRVARALRGRFSPTPNTAQPVMVTNLDGRLAAAAYIFKRLTDPRALLLRQTIPAQTADRGTQRTRFSKLPWSERAELVKFLGGLALEERLIVPEKMTKMKGNTTLFQLSS